MEDSLGYIARLRLKGKKEQKKKEQKGRWRGCEDEEGASGRDGQRQPSSELGAQQLFRQTWRGCGQKGKEEQEVSTPELPDQVIAVRCQSAAERGRGERRDMRHQSRMGQRENVSQEPTPAPWFLVA